MKTKEWMGIIIINVFLIFIISSISVANHNKKYIHFESMYNEDGSVTIYPESKGALRGSQYVEYKDDLNPQLDYYRNEERYVDYVIPVFSMETNFVRTKDGDLINRTVRCYYKGETIDCSENWSKEE